MSISASTTNTTSNLHLIRRAKRLSLKRLAELTGICHTKISNLENGLRPRKDELSKIAAALGCRVNDLTQNADIHAHTATNSDPKKTKSPAGSTARL